MIKDIQTTEPFTESVGSVLAPNGVYNGTMNGNKVKFQRNGTTYQFQTKNYLNISETIKIVVRNTKGYIYLEK